MRKLYQHVDPLRKIGATSGKEFSIFSENGKMFILYKNGDSFKVSDENTSHILEEGVSSGVIEIIDENEFLS